MKGFFKDENGAVLVIEAAIVFPIMIFIVITFIFFGNLLYQQSRMDAIVVRAGQYMGAVYTDPILLEATNGIPTEIDDVQPYRFLFGASKAETKTKQFINKEIDNLNAGLFSDMEVKNTQVTCNLKNCIIYQQAEIQVKYTIWMPLSFFGLEPNMKFSAATTTAITCPEEFIRNIDMIGDYMEETGLSGKIQEKWDTLKMGIGKFF